LLWVSPPGDYAIINSNHIPDGTATKTPSLLIVVMPVRAAGRRVSFFIGSVTYLTQRHLQSTYSTSRSVR
jgi:hypothetical protein